MAKVEEGCSRDQVRTPTEEYLQRNKIDTWRKERGSEKGGKDRPVEEKDKSGQQQPFWGAGLENSRESNWGERLENFL